MTTTSPTAASSPSAIDEALAAAHLAAYQIKFKLTSQTNFVQCAYGDRLPGYGSRKYSTTEQQVWERIATAAATGDAHNVMVGKRPSELLAKREALLAELAAAKNVIAGLDALYTGWSRFFLVTSSAGHIHSSTSCHTCRSTTTYGWQPELSGKTEQEAVAKLGPALCTACFPSAPTDYTHKKITKAQAAKLTA